MEGKKHICNATCWVASKREMFVPGQFVYFFEGEEVPSHFSCLEPVKEIVVEKPKVEIIEKPKVEEDIIVNPIIVDKEEEIKPKFRRPTLSKE
jgi:hypothetical protein